MEEELGCQAECTKPDNWILSSGKNVGDVINKYQKEIPITTAHL